MRHESGPAPTLIRHKGRLTAAPMGRHCEMSRASGVVSVLLCTVACSPTSQQPAKSTLVPEAPQVSAQATPLTATAPDEVLLFVEQLPSERVERAAHAISGRRVSLSLALPAELEQLREPNAPVHTLVYLDASPLRLSPRAQHVRAVALKSHAEASEALARLASGGYAKLSHEGALSRVVPRHGHPCVLGKSAEGARLVCGPEPALTRCAGHLLSRPATLAASEDGTKILATLPVRKLETRFGSLLRKGRALLPIVAKSELERQGGDMARVLAPLIDDGANEGLALFGDTEEIEARLRETSGGVELSATLRLRSAKGWLAAAAKSVSTQKSARSAFERLPQSAEFALFNAGLPASVALDVEQFTSKYLRAVFGPGYSEASVLIAKTFVPDVGLAYAHGDALGRDARRIGHGGESIRESTLSVWGYHLLAYEEDPQVYVPLLKRGMDTYNQGELRRLAYQELGRLCPGLPNITRDPPPKGLPLGSERFAMTFSGKFFDSCGHGMSDGKPAQQAALVVLLAPTPARTWIGVSADEAGLVRLINQGMTGKDILAVDADLKPLRDARALFGGFATLRGIASLRRNVLQSESMGGRRSRFDALPKRGATRMPWKVSVEPATPANVQLWARLPDEAVDDMLAMRGSRVRSADRGF